MRDCELAEGRSEWYGEPYSQNTEKLWKDNDKNHTGYRRDSPTHFAFMSSIDRNEINTGLGLNSLLCRSSTLLCEKHAHINEAICVEEALIWIESGFTVL